MKNQNPVNWFQVLALCSTLALGGAYVWSRQKQAAPPPITPPVPVATSETMDGQATPVPVEVNAQRLVLSGSKSGILMPTPSNDHDDDGEGKPKEPRVLMPGSKSALIAPQPQPDDPPKQRTLLPGSKSIDGILKPLPQTPPKQSNENP